MCGILLINLIWKFSKLSSNKSGDQELKIILLKGTVHQLYRGHILSLNNTSVSDVCKERGFSKI